MGPAEMQMGTKNMEQHSLSENPYSSPNVRSTEHVNGAVWEDERVTVEFERVLEDYVIAEWFRMQHHRSRGREVLRLVIIAALTVLALWLLSQITGGLNAPIIVVAVIYFAYLVWAVSLPRRLHMVRRILSRWIASDAHEYLTSVRVTFGADGFESTSQWERRFRQWSAAGRLVELGDCYLLVRGGVVTLLLPKRAFADVEETERFLKWIGRHVPVNVG